MKQINYNLTPPQNIIKDGEQIIYEFFRNKSLFLIPDFSKEPIEVLPGYLKWISKQNKTVLQNDGGEFTEFDIDETTGLCQCTYSADIILPDSDITEIEITGWVTKDATDTYLFIANSINIDEQ